MQEETDNEARLDELAAHRDFLVCLVVALHHGRTWKSRVRPDGLIRLGTFLVGLPLDGRLLVYELPEALWPCCLAEPWVQAPAGELPTSDEVLQRITAYLMTH